MADRMKKEFIHAQGFDIGIYTTDYENEFISLTDIAKYKSDSPNDVIKNWMRNRETLEFLGLWERLHNADFKPVEFDGFRKEAGLHAFTMSPAKWIESVNAIGIVSKAGRYGGTYATLSQLLVLANMESYNAILIDQGKPMSERLVLLRRLALKQLETLSEVSMNAIKRLPGGES